MHDQTNHKMDHTELTAIRCFSPPLKTSIQSLNRQRKSITVSTGAKLSSGNFSICGRLDCIHELLSKEQLHTCACMALWGTSNLHWDCSSFMWHQPCQRCKYTTSVDIQRRAIKSYSLVVTESHASAVSSRERRIALNKSDQQSNKANQPTRAPTPSSRRDTEQFDCPAAASGFHHFIVS